MNLKLISFLFLSRQRRSNDDLEEVDMEDQRNRKTEDGRRGGHCCVKQTVNPDTFNGDGSFGGYLMHFEMVSELNGWNEEEMMMHLAVSLRDEALQVIRSLPIEERRSYQGMVNALTKRYDPINKAEVSRAQLSLLHRKTGEELPKLAQTVKELVASTYPELGGLGETFEKLCRNHFIDALGSSHLKRSVWEANPCTLDAAVIRALECETFDEAERLRSGERGLVADRRMEIRDINVKSEKQENGEIKQLTELVHGLTGVVNGLAMKMSHWEEAWKENLRCYKCGKWGHKKEDCKQGRIFTCYTCGKVGHLSQNCPDTY